MTTKASALRAHRKAQRAIREFLHAIPNRPLTASEEAKRQRLISAEKRTCAASWHADDSPPVRRKVSELRAELQADQRKREQDPKPQPAVPVNRRRAAIHEAAHAVGFEARGVRVLSVTLQECRPDRPEAVAALCGAIAARRDGFDDAHSPTDIAMAEQVLRSEGKSKHRILGVESEARELVAARWLVILGVAAALWESGKLTGDQVRGLMNRSAWELQEEERHYRQYAHTQRMPRRFAW